jgi:hypothetical protein
MGIILRVKPLEEEFRIQKEVRSQEEFRIQKRMSCAEI